MEEVSATWKHAKISAQKGRLVADQIRGMSAEKAIQLLDFSPKKAAKMVSKVLNSAIANAENNKGYDIDSLIVSTIYVSEATTHKRMRARAKGRGTRILKRTSHITIKVAEK